MVYSRGVYIILFIYFGKRLLSEGIEIKAMQNSRLKSGHFSTLDLIGMKMCEKQCSRYKDCKAINFNKRHLSCELLTVTGLESPEHLHHEEDTVHIYNISKSQLTNLCTNKTCPAYHRCVDSNTKAFCVVTGCPTTGLVLLNGNISSPLISVGENLHFECHQGYSKPNVTLACLSSGKIQNTEQMACYKKDGLWTLAYRIQSSSGVHPLNAYLDSGVQQERNASFRIECLDKAKVAGCVTPYRAGLIDTWNKLKITKIRFSINFPNVTKEIIFDGLGSTITSWFSQTRVKSSSWLDLSATGSSLYFTMSLELHRLLTRYWYIVKLHNECPGDLGWLTASFDLTDGCAFDLTDGSYPLFRGCPGNTSCLYENESIEAETIAVSVKTDHLI